MIDFDAARTQLQDRVDEKNARLAGPAVYHYTKGNTYFKLKACPGCRSKKRVELVVES